MRTDLGDPLPGGLTLDRRPDRRPAQRARSSVGSHGRARLRRRRPCRRPPATLLPVLMFTRNVDPTLGTGVRWFVLAVGGHAAARCPGRRAAEPAAHQAAADATEATARIAAGDLSRAPAGPRRRQPTDELADLARSINDDGRRARTVAGPRAAVPALGVPRPAHAADVDPRLRRGDRRRRRPDDRAAAGIILAESRRLERLVRDLLDLAKLEARQFSLDLVRRSTSTSWSSDSVDGFRREVEEAGLQLRLDRSGRPGAPPSPTPTAWPRWWPTSSRTRSSTPSRVDHRGRDRRRRLASCVEVADDGPGIAAEDLPHVFERLYVAGHQPVRKEIGSGLGLAIVRELVDAMGGTVRAEADPGGGARMVVTLRPVLAPPRRRSAPSPPVRPRRTGSAGTVGPSGSRRTADVDAPWPATRCDRAVGAGTAHAAGGRGPRRRRAAGPAQLDASRRLDRAVHVGQGDRAPSAGDRAELVTVPTTLAARRQRSLGADRRHDVALDARGPAGGGARCRRGCRCGPRAPGRCSSPW